MAAVGSLASGAAHEINNPLSAVMGNLDYVLQHLGAHRAGGLFGAEQVADLQLALADGREGATRIRDVVKNLMVFMGADNDHQTSMNVRRLVQAAIGIVGNEIRHRARLVEQYEDVPLVDGNGARLSQVFVQLLVNAAQAIPEGASDRHEVRVRTFRDPLGHAVIEVHDSGVGISREQLPRIFDPFYTTKPLGTATGLGLSTAHAIVTKLGGTIRVESEPGAGSTFCVVLPPAAASAKRAPDVQPTPPVVGVPSVLVVDDEPAVGAMLRRQLAPSFQVASETDARVALSRIVSGEAFDVILCDVMMPGMSGVDFFEELSRVAPEKARRTIFITGGAFTARALEFLERVPNPRLKKPFERDELVTQIRRCLL
jgi:CheY-like chemotaxis protein